MAFTLFSFVDLYARVLDTAAHLLTKAADHAAEIGVSEADMLQWRLIDDMQPLGFQIMVVCNFSCQWPARAAGLPPPEDIGADLTLAAFQTAIIVAKAYLAALTPDQFAERDDVPLTISLGGGQLEPTLTVERWLGGFATTSLYFHLSTAYAILRARGVPIGKPDLFAGGL